MKTIAILKKQDQTTIGVNEDGYIVVSQECSIGGEAQSIWIAPENAKAVIEGIMNSIGISQGQQFFNSMRQILSEE